VQVTDCRGFRRMRGPISSRPPGKNGSRVIALRMPLFAGII